MEKLRDGTVPQTAPEIWYTASDGKEKIIVHRNELTGHVRRMTRETVMGMVDPRHFELLHEYRTKVLATKEEAERLLMSILASKTLQGDAAAAQMFREEVRAEVARRERQGKAA